MSKPDLGKRTKRRHQRLGLVRLAASTRHCLARQSLPRGARKKVHNEHISITFLWHPKKYICMTKSWHCIAELICFEWIRGNDADLITFSSQNWNILFALWCHIFVTKLWWTILNLIKNCYTENKLTKS